MSPEIVLQVIGSYGFPIIGCIGMAWYVKYITDYHNQATKELNKQHQEEINDVKDQVVGAINNNTLVMQKLCDMLVLDKKGSESNEIK